MGIFRNWVNSNNNVQHAWRMAWKQAHRNIFYVIKKAEEEECSSTENTQEKSLRLKCLVMWFPGETKHSSGYQHVKTSMMISLYVRLLHTVQVWRLLWVDSHWWNIPLSPEVEVYSEFQSFFPFLSSLSSVMYTTKRLYYISRSLIDWQPVQCVSWCLSYAVTSVGAITQKLIITQGENLVILEGSE